MNRIIARIAFAGAIVMASALPVYAGHFVWGADTGVSVDVNGHDMSTYNIDAYFGYKGPYLDIAGIGGGIHMMVSNSCRAFPVYAIVRSSFSAKPQLIYAEMRAGVAVDEMDDGPSRTRAWVNPSIGINLARSRNFCSYISLGYCINDLHWYGSPAADRVINLHNGMSYMNVRIGIRF